MAKNITGKLIKHLIIAIAIAPTMYFTIFAEQVFGYATSAFALQINTQNTLFVMFSLLGLFLLYVAVLLYSKAIPQKLMRYLLTFVDIFMPLYVIIQIILLALVI